MWRHCLGRATKVGDGAGTDYVDVKCAECTATEGAEVDRNRGISLVESGRQDERRVVKERRSLSSPAK